MELLRYEILHTDQGRAVADRIREQILQDPMLGPHSDPWTSPALPGAAALFAMIVVLTDDVGADAAIRARVAAGDAAGFPVIPVVEDVATYDFGRAPILALTARNAVGLADPGALLDTLLRHGGLRRYGTGGRVFISYARRDGSTLADGLRDGLQDAGFRCFVDRVELEGGIRIQPRIKQEIAQSDLLVLIDSSGAARSRWVAAELDFARAAHVPVIAISPTQDAFHHAFRAPHVAWEAGSDVQAVIDEAVGRARRILAAKESFRDRVARVLERVCMLRGWRLGESYPPWIVDDALHIESCEEEPSPEQVYELAQRVRNQRGMLVGGTRPYSPITRRVFGILGGHAVCVTPLSSVATWIPLRLAANALSGRRVLLSAAMPDSTDQDAASTTLVPFVVTLVQALVELGATIVFGGHPSVTPLVHEALVDVAREGSGGIELHQAQRWLADAPDVVNDRNVFRTVRWHGDGKDVAADLAALRDGMLQPGLDAAVFIGGKVKEALTVPPGLVDEHRRFRSACPQAPAFVVGMARGAALELLPHEPPLPPSVVDPRLAQQLRETSDPDLAVALIVAELVERSA